MSTKAVFFIGPPGAGKSTQSRLVCDKKDFYHLETSEVIKEKLNDDEAVSKSSELQKIKKIFESGELCPKEWTEGIVIQKLRDVSAQGRGVIFSGSPRRVAEAETELPIAEELFGRNGIRIIRLKVTPEEAIRRNSSKKVCAKFNHLMPDNNDSQLCLIDGSPVERRPFDSPEIIRKRYDNFMLEGVPVLDYLKNRGYEVLEIDGERPIEEVHGEIMRYLS